MFPSTRTKNDYFIWSDKHSSALWSSSSPKIKGPRDRVLELLPANNPTLTGKGNNGEQMTFDNVPSDLVCYWVMPRQVQVRFYLWSWWDNWLLASFSSAQLSVEELIVCFGPVLLVKGWRILFLHSGLGMVWRDSKDLCPRVSSMGWKLCVLGSR